MSILDATVSMLEALPEDARIKVFKFTRQLFISENLANFFVPVGTKQILSDLAESREQIVDGEGMNMSEALNEMGGKHGFV